LCAASSTSDGLTGAIMTEQLIKKTRSGFYFGSTSQFQLFQDFYFVLCFLQAPFQGFLPMHSGATVNKIYKPIVN
ncbi:MAG: hypothetical protein NTZ02_00715, partial [Candidatus Woesearchaeota archaeon]|nr:hypothetical protein [Candidatus Woesearchaeota archaeon]